MESTCRHILPSIALVDTITLNGKSVVSFHPIISSISIEEDTLAFGVFLVSVCACACMCVLCECVCVCVCV